MNDKTWWIIMLAWAVMVIVTVAWMWFQVRKVDRMQDVDFDALFLEVSEELAEREDTMKQEAGIPISAAAFQERARKAEGLGFLDNDPPRVA